MNLFPSKFGARGKAAGPGGSAGFQAHDLTPEKISVLSQIDSPWARVSLSSVDPQNALRDALRSLTPEQLAEFVFVMGHPGCESRTLLAKGRSEFTSVALAFVLRQISAEVLGALAADGGALVVDATMRNLPNRN